MIKPSVLAALVAAIVVASSAEAAPAVISVSDIGGATGCVAQADHLVGFEQHDAATDNCVAAQGMMELHHVTLSHDGHFVYTVAGVNVYPEEQSTLRIFVRNAGTGGVTMVPGRAGCVERMDATIDIGCSQARNIQGIRSVTISPDDRFLYVTGAGGISAFSRNAKTGAVSQLAGKAGCYSAYAADCTRTPGSSIPLSTALMEDLTFTKDGTFAYGANSNGYVLQFTRNVSTGALTPMGCFHGGTVSPRQGCTAARSIDAARSVTLSPDERFAYVANIDDGLAIFARNAKTGRLTQLSGTAGCISETGAEGCSTGRGIYGSHRLTIAPDGRTAYLAGKRAGGKGSTLVTFSRDIATGALTETGCDTEGGNGAAEGCTVGRDIMGAHYALLSPDGKALFVASDQLEGGLAIFNRDPATGAITQQQGTAGCIGSVPWEGCGTSRRMGGIHFLAWSPDGRFLYVAGESSAALIVLRVAS